MFLLSIGKFPQQECPLPSSQKRPTTYSKAVQLSSPLEHRPASSMQLRQPSSSRQPQQSWSQVYDRCCRCGSWVWEAAGSIPWGLWEGQLSSTFPRWSWPQPPCSQCKCFRTSSGTSSIASRSHSAVQLGTVWDSCRWFRLVSWSKSWGWDCRCPSWCFCAGQRSCCRWREA